MIEANSMIDHCRTDGTTCYYIIIQIEPETMLSMYSFWRQTNCFLGIFSPLIHRIEGLSFSHGVLCSTRARLFQLRASLPITQRSLSSHHTRSPLIIHDWFNIQICQEHYWAQYSVVLAWFTLDCKKHSLLTTSMCCTHSTAHSVLNTCPDTGGVIETILISNSGTQCICAVPRFLLD